jgi:hypothetical protein
MTGQTTTGKRGLAAIAILVVAGLTLQACQSADLKKAAQASEDIAISIKLAIATNQDLAKQGIITGAEALMIDRVLLVLNEADQSFVATARTYTKWDATSKAALAALFVDITNAINRLQGTVGVLLDQRARDALATIVASLTVASATLRVILS